MTAPHEDHANDPFVADTLALLRAESSRAQEDRLDDALRQAPRPSWVAPRRVAVPARTYAVRYALTALAAAALAAIITYVLMRAVAPESPGDAFALDGGVGTAPGAAAITRDAQGRPNEIATRVGGRLEGERVVFRAGQVIRIEHYRDGQLDGPALDFDGLGRLVRTTTFVAGRERGPFLELAPDGSVRASGDHL